MFKPSTALLSGISVVLANVAFCQTVAESRAESLAQADLVQSALNCVANFEQTTAEQPEYVWVEGRNYRLWKYQSSPPKVGKLTCGFAALADVLTGQGGALPACRLQSGWHAFGSGFGKVTWAVGHRKCFLNRPIPTS